MDTELIKYVRTAAEAWAAWQKSQKTKLDQVALALKVSAVPARAKILWESQDYTTSFRALADIALVDWQVILDDPKKVTDKQFADAIIRTGIVERSRIRLETDGVPGDYSQVLYTLAKASPAGLIVGLISGEITIEGMFDDVADTVNEAEELGQQLEEKTKQTWSWLKVAGGVIAGIATLFAVGYVARAVRPTRIEPAPPRLPPGADDGA